MLASPFPSSIGFSAVSPSDLGGFELYPVEAAALSPKAIAKRVVHFRLGRAAARRALGELGFAPQPIPRAEDGRPLWPAKVVGAITHTEDIAAAAVGHASDFTGIGLDLESLGRQVSPDVARRICSEQELTWVRQQDPDQRILMVFAAKEAIFKALYPINRVFLGFADAEVTWAGAAGAFSAVLHKRAADAFPAGVEFQVGCRVVKGLVLAYMHLPKES